jgi:biopolymer transport protein TolR
MGKSKRAEKAEDLNLVPIMNLVTILIPFLLMASSFVTLAAIDSTLPAIGAPPTETPDEDEEKLNLSIVITNEGWTIAGADAVLGSSEEGEDAGPTVPCTKPGCPTTDAYDKKELTRILGTIKDRFPDEENVILVPESEVPYEVLILTMDSTRDDPDTKEDGKARLLFPFVVIAGGAQ